MASRVSTLTPAGLAAILSRLPVCVEAAEVERCDVKLADYPGGPRPSSVVHLRGAGKVGRGEQVAFTEDEHRSFAHFVAAWRNQQPNSAAARVDSRHGVAGTPYDHAALEAALIDLGLRQAEQTLSALCGEVTRDLRVVVSFAASPQPRQVIERWREAGYDGDFKVDVDPAWDDSVLNELREEASVAICDFKGRAGAWLAARLAEVLPRALLEDPPVDFDPAVAPGRVARDASLLQVREVMEACRRGEAVNLKAPRMSGPLAVLAGLECALGTGAQARRAGRPRVECYLGGMFEVSVGRTQAQQLAALFCATAPNDLAPNMATPAGNRLIPAAFMPIRLDTPGFGYD